MTTILVADDEVANRALIGALLADRGYRLVEAADGAEAIRAFERERIDLVLLDVLMPVLDGFEVTRRIRTMQGHLFLPIVLVTALTDPESRRRGLEAGADDFLSKPLDGEELVLRTRNLLRLREQARALEERNVEHLELRRFRDDMTALILHDLKNPLAAMVFNIQFAAEEWGTPEGQEALGDAAESGKRLTEIVQGLAEIQRLESARVQPVCDDVRVGELVAPALASRRCQLQGRGIVTEAVGLDDVTVQVDRSLILRVIENLLDNALRHAPSSGRIQLRAVVRDRRVDLRIGNSGPAVPVEARGRLFQKYVQASASQGRTNLGLGLYFCRLAVEAHGGHIRIEEEPGLGSVFVIELPGGHPVPVRCCG